MSRLEDQDLQVELEATYRLPKTPEVKNRQHRKKPQRKQRTSETFNGIHRRRGRKINW